MFHQKSLLFVSRLMPMYEIRLFAFWFCQFYSFELFTSTGLPLRKSISPYANAPNAIFSRSDLFCPRFDFAYAHFLVSLDSLKVKHTWRAGERERERTTFHTVFNCPDGCIYEIQSVSVSQFHSHRWPRIMNRITNTFWKRKREKEESISPALSVRMT